MAVGDIIELTLITARDVQAANNVRHYRIGSQPSANPPGLAAVAAALQAALVPPFKAMLSEKAFYVGLTVQRIRPVPPSVAVQNITGAGFGNRIGDVLPWQVSGLISLRTPLAGRRFRGRFYMPFPAQIENTDSGHPTTVYKAFLDALAAQLILSRTVVDGISSATYDPIVFSRDTNGFTVIDSFITQQRWATQRRRGQFGQPNLGGQGTVQDT